MSKLEYTFDSSDNHPCTALPQKWKPITVYLTQIFTLDTSSISWNELRVAMCNCAPYIDVNNGVPLFSLRRSEFGCVRWSFSAISPAQWAIHPRNSVTEPELFPRWNLIECSKALLGKMLHCRDLLDLLVVTKGFISIPDASNAAIL